MFWSLAISPQDVRELHGPARLEATSRWRHVTSRSAHVISHDNAETVFSLLSSFFYPPCLQDEAFSLRRELNVN